MPQDFQGNVPPHDLDVERAVLGAMLTGRENIYKVIEVIGESLASPFYDPRHASIYDAIIALNTRQEPSDMLTVANELRRRGQIETVGGAYYITQLTENVTSSARVEAHARIVLEKFLLRELIKVSQKTIVTAFEEADSPETIIDGAERSIFDLAERSLRGSIRPMNELAHDTMEYIEKLSENKRGITGIASGLPALDNVTSGFQNSDLIIVAARPSVGKTSLALSIARHAAVKEENSVGFFSLEMSAQQLVLRLVCADAMVNSSALRSGRFSPKQMQEMSMAIGRLAKTKFFIDDTSAISVLELYAKRRMAATTASGGARAGIPGIG